MCRTRRQSACIFRDGGNTQHLFSFDIRLRKALFSNHKTRFYLRDSRNTYCHRYRNVSRTFIGKIFSLQSFLRNSFALFIRLPFEVYARKARKTDGFAAFYVHCSCRNSSIENQYTKLKISSGSITVLSSPSAFSLCASIAV